MAFGNMELRPSFAVFFPKEKKNVESSRVEEIFSDFTNTMYRCPFLQNQDNVIGFVMGVPNVPPRNKALLSAY